MNGYVKKYTRRKFNDWYSSQIGKQLDAGKQLHDIDVPLLLSHLKPSCTVDGGFIQSHDNRRRQRDNSQWMEGCWNHRSLHLRD